MVFRLAAPAVDILVKYTGVADLQVGDDEACVGSALASTTIRSTRLQLAAPSKNSLKRRALPSFGAASKRAWPRGLDVPAQRRGRRDPQDIIETIGSHQSRTSGQQ